jgi:transketolase
MADVNLLHRILDIAYKNRLSHLGSYFSSVDIIDNVYNKMDKEDIFILSSGHCALALYAVVEKYRGIDAEYLFATHGGHPHRCENDGLYCSTGSLGMGITAAVGRAIAKPDRIVHCLISDGECAEGSIWESLKFIYEHNIKNIKIYVNVNGYAAYDAVDTSYLIKRLKAFLPSINIIHTDVNAFPFLRGLNAHYHIMKEEDYKLAKEVLNEKRI